MMQVNIKIPRELWNEFSAYFVRRGQTRREGLIELLEKFIEEEKDKDDRN